MTAQFFPNTEEIFVLLMGEIPAGVYSEDFADDETQDDDGDYPLRSYSSSELRAHAEIFNLLYQNLSDINDNKSVTTANSDGLKRYEKDFFLKIQDGSLSIEARRQNLLSKMRAIGGINYPTIRNIAAGVLAPLDFDILPYSGMNSGAWILDESSLGLNTWLSKIDPLYGYLLDNDLDWAAAGITQQQLLDIQEVAYTYEVRIYGNASPETLALLDQQLTSFEPARSTHIIRNNSVRPID